MGASERFRHEFDAVKFQGSHFDELPPPGEQVLDSCDMVVRVLGDARLNNCGEPGDNPSIDGIGFCELTDGAGVAAYVQWVDDDRPVALDGGFNKRALIATGELNDDALKLKPGQSAKEFAHALHRVLDADSDVSLVNVPIEACVSRHRLQR